MYLGQPLNSVAGTEWSIKKPDGTTTILNATGNPVTLPSTLFNQPGFYQIIVKSLANQFCESDPFTLEVVNPPAAPSSISGEEYVCLNYPYTYSIPYKDGTVAMWSVTGGLINGSATFAGNEAVVVWNATGLKSITVHRVWEDLPGCASGQYSQPIQDISLAGTISSTSNQFYEDMTYQFDCNLGTGVVADVYEWIIIPAGYASIAAGQGTPQCFITILHLTNTTGITIQCKVTKCGLQNTLSHSITAEKNTEITSVIVTPSTTVCSGETVSFEVLTSGAPLQEIYWNFGDGFNSVTTTHITSHTFQNILNNNITFSVIIQAVSSTTQLVTSSYVQYITVLPQPNAVLTPSTPFLYPGSGTACTLLVSTPAPPTSYSFAWYFEPAPTIVNTAPILLATTTNQHIVSPLPSTSPNIYDGFYYCIVTDANGCTTTTTKTAIGEDNYNGGGPNCTPQPPAGITGFSHSLLSCATVQVSCTTLGSSNIYNYQWGVDAPASDYTIGSGGSQNLSPPITIHKAGSYAVVLTVNYFSVSSPPLTCYVNGTTFVDIPWVADFMSSFSCNGSNQYSLNLFDYSSVHPAYNVTNYTWTVSNGSVTYTYSGQVFPAYPVVAGVNYTVSLTIGDGILPNCTKTIQITVPSLPVAEFEAYTTYPGNQPFTTLPYKSCEEREIIFTNLSTVMGDIISHKWDFGNTKKSYMLQPGYAYPSGGGPITYTIQLTVQDKYGCVNIKSKDIEVFDNTLMENPPQYNPPLLAECPGTSISPSIQPNYSSNTSISPTINHTFQWYKDDQSLSGIITPAFGSVVNTSGGYWVKITDQHNCFLDLNPVPALITVPSVPTAFIKGKQDFCFGTPGILKSVTGMPATASLSYLWDCFNILNPALLVASSNQKDFIFNLPIPGTFIVKLKVTDNITGCSSESIDYQIKANPLPAKPVLDLQVLDCDLYEIELSCTNTSAYTSNAIFNWSTGVTGTSTLVYNGGAYRLLVTDSYGCKNQEDIKIPYPPNFYFWRFPTGCYSFCPEYLPREVWPMMWTYGDLGVGFADWAWKRNGNNVIDNGGNPLSSNCQPSLCFLGYQNQNSIFCAIPCRLQIDLPPKGEGSGEYTWMLDNNLCAQESEVMDVSIDDCCKVDMRVDNIRCIQMSSAGNTYSFDLSIFNVPCNASYNMIIKDNQGFIMNLNLGSLTPTQLSSGTNTLSGEFTADPNSSDVTFFLEVFCQPKCQGKSTITPLPPCTMKKMALTGEPSGLSQDGAYLALYPNPANNQITINYRFPDTTSSQNPGYIAITDATGRPVLNLPVEQLQGTKQAQITTFAPGVYFATLRNHKQHFTTRKMLVIQR